jgi:prolipoprotein diacylglyceryltransferase
MYPIIEIWWIQIYTFWITLSISFFLFLWMLRKLSQKADINFSFFTNRILYFFLSTVIFSRIFYLIANWKTEASYIDNFVDFFIMENYNFSLWWAIFGFLLVLIISLKKASIDFRKYLDISVIALYFVLVFWYIWALFWWQVVWKPTDYWIELHYDNSFAPIWPDVWVFPLAIIYSIVFFIVFFIFYSLNLFVKTKWFLGTIWLMLLWWIIFSLDGFNYFKDDFVGSLWISFAQLCSLIAIFGWFIFLFFLKEDREIRKELNKE